jgi:hypothetical protein
MALGAERLEAARLARVPQKWHRFAETNPGFAMGTATTREQLRHKTIRYQSDLTDEEWLVIKPHLPAASATGRPRSWSMREIVNGIFYVMRASDFLSVPSMI